MDAGDALTALWRGLETRGAPPFDWVVEHASDGDVDRAIRYFWVRCKDPHELERLARRGLDRVTLVEGQIVLGRYLARHYPRATRAAYEATAEFARNWANGFEYTWKEVDSYADEIDAAIGRALRGLESTRGDYLVGSESASAWYKFTLFARMLVRRARIATRRKHFWEVEYAVAFLVAWRGIGKRFESVGQRTPAAEHDVARVLRNAWPAPTIAQLMEPR